MERVLVSGLPLEPDYDRPITDAELVDALLKATRPVKPGEFVDVDFRGNDAIGI